MRPFLLLSICVGLALASNSSTGAQACSDLSNKFPNSVAYPPLDLLHPNPSDLNFTYTLTHYWNGGNGDLVPSCIFYPANASQVSDAVQILNNYPDVPFATKSGGHNPNKGWSSVAGGVLISFRPFMKTTTLSQDQSLAYVQPGSRWTEVMEFLDSYNKAVVSGRLGDVGVAGLTLGGGLSFLSSEYGLVCDRVAEYEVVLADGTIATVNNSTNTDLFYALKGGGNQFAIVTKFTMLTVPIGQIWGGIKIFTADKAAALLNATHDFAENYPDKKAAVIVTYESLVDSLVDVFFIFFFYNGATVPSGVFDKFDAIEPLLDQTKVQTYSSLMSNNDEGNIYGFNYLIRAQTLPLLAGDDGKALLQYQYESLTQYAAKTQPQNLDLMVYNFAIQPLSVIIQEASQAAGLSMGQQNALGLDPNNGDRLWIEYDVSWVNQLDQQHAYDYARHLTSDIVAYTMKNYPNAVSTKQKNAGANQFGPLFMNDGMFDQATSSFFTPQDYQNLKGIQRNRDPKGFFSGRTGGFKFT